MSGLSFVNVEAAYIRMAKQLGHPFIGQARSPSELHRLRVILKRAEYSLEAKGRSIQPIVRIQTLIGDAHDLKALIHLIERARLLIHPVITFTIAQLAHR